MSDMQNKWKMRMLTSGSAVTAAGGGITTSVQALEESPRHCSCPCTFCKERNGS